MARRSALCAWWKGVRDMIKIPHIRARAICSASLATILFLPIQAVAQDADAGAPIGAQGRPPKYQVQVNGSAADKSASVSFDVLRTLNEPRVSSNGTVTTNDTSLNLTLSTPWDGENDALPASLNGLASGTSATLTLNRYFAETNQVESSVQTALLEKAARICRAKAVEVRSGALLRLGPSPTTEARDAVQKAYLDTLKTCDPATAQTDLLANTYLTPRDARVYTVGSFAQNSFSLGLTGSVAHDKFDYVDPANLAAGKESHVSWSFGAAFTLYPRRSPTALAFSVRYERSYAAADSKILCPLAAGATVATCVNKPAGAPVLDRSYLVSLGLRHRFWRGDKLAGLAIAPTVTYDASDDVFGAELPVYFVPSKDGGPTGGVKVGYRSDTDNVTFGIFVGAAFGIVN